MPKSELIWLLFTDSFFTNLAITFDNEIFLSVILAFNKLSQIEIILILSAAYLISNYLNYFLGTVIGKIISDQAENSNSYDISKKRLSAIKIMLNKFGNFIPVIFIFFPVLGKFYLIICGISKYRKIYSILAVTMSKLIYDFYFLNFII